MKSEGPDFRVEGLGSKGEARAGGSHRGHQQMEAAGRASGREGRQGPKGTAALSGPGDERGEPAGMTKTEGPGKVEDWPSVA